MNRFQYPFLLIGLAVLLLSACQSETSTSSENASATTASRLGEVDFTVTSASTEALAAFEKGLLLLHSFEYEDAREAFQEAQELDSDFAMAYWGEAMTHNHSLWARQDYEAATEALAKLAATAEQRIAKAPTGLERDFLKAVHVLYGEGAKYERDQAYAEFMEELYRKYPENQEVAAFYSLSLLGSVNSGRDEETYGKGAIIAKGVLEENPHHPGALHYLIHSYDDPEHAHLAKKAADSYANVAPDAAHALHMPSHIYVAMGMWKEVVASNIDSYDASLKRMERKQLDNDARSYHALHWLMYGYLQQGRLEEVNQIMKNMQKYTAELPSKRARAYLISMKGNYLAETGDWTHPYADIPVKDEDLSLVVRATEQYIAARKAHQDDQVTALRDTIEAMAREREKAALLVGDSGIALCNAAGWTSNAPNQLDVDQAHVLEMQLRGLLADLEKRTADADRWLAKAAELENRISYSYGPPVIIDPSSELYASWLYRQDRYKEALEQYEYALERGPRRVKALLGKRETLIALDRLSEAAQVEATLLEIEQAGREMQLSEGAGGGS